MLLPEGHASTKNHVLWDMVGYWQVVADISEELLPQISRPRKSVPGFQPQSSLFIIRANVKSVSPPYQGAYLVQFVITGPIPSWLLAIVITCKLLINHSKRFLHIRDAMKVPLIILSSDHQSLQLGSFLIPVRILIARNCFISLQLLVETVSHLLVSERHKDQFDTLSDL